MPTVDRTDPAELRKPYLGAPLRRADLADQPMTQFHVWIEEAHESGLA
jgi:pyridoxamine 5'-phosphate oxidase